MGTHIDKYRLKHIIWIGQISVYFGLFILTLRNYAIMPANGFYLLAIIMLIGFLPSALVSRWSRRRIEYVLVLNALVIVSIVFAFLQEWALGGVFILVPVFSLLFKDRNLYIFASAGSVLSSTMQAVFFIARQGKPQNELVNVIDQMSVLFILIFLIYFVVKDLMKQSVLETKNIQTITALTRSVEAKDTYTFGHSDRVAWIGEFLAAKVPEADAKKVYYSGLIHDVGKLSIPDMILLKKESLTHHEYAVMKTHTLEGAKICSSLDIDEELVLGVLHHHERWDGKGYPHGLAGDRIPLIARILCVADCLDAMFSNRAYRGALSADVVRGEIDKGSGMQFDPRLAALVLRHWETIIAYLNEQRNAVNEPASDFRLPG